MVDPATAGATHGARALLPSVVDPARLLPLPPGVKVTRYDGPSPPEHSAAEFFVPALPPPAGVSEILRRLAGLQVVQVLTAGVDWILDAVPAGVRLCSARGVHDASTAEWVVTAILAMNRDIPRLVLAQQRKLWDYHVTLGLTGKTVLIVGAGSIGSAVERRLEPFGLHVLRVARRARTGVAGVEELPDLLPAADVVVLLVPLTRATDGMVDARFLERMRDGALLVNASRGRLVNTGALLAELRSTRLRAALDVTDPEPLPTEHPLWSAPGVLVTPHVAGSTPAFLGQAHQLLREQLGRFVRCEPLVNTVVGDY